MRRSIRLVLVMPLALLAACGVLQQRSSVSRNFQARFGCPSASVSAIGEGYRVEGCGQSARYVCFTRADHHHVHRERYGRPKPGEVVAGALFTAAFAGTGERCVLASSSERYAHTPVANDAPPPVRRSQSQAGDALLRTRVLFAGGHLRALAAPREHPEHVLLIVHGVARMAPAPCQAELFHDGVPVPVLQMAREGAYEARLAVPVQALEGADKSVRFAGSVCGIELQLDAKARAALGLFAARFREERARLLPASGVEPVTVRSAAPTVAAEAATAPQARPPLPTAAESSVSPASAP